MVERGMEIIYFGLKGRGFVNWLHFVCAKMTFSFQAGVNLFLME